MTSWGHGHSIIVGVLGGVLLSQHLILVGGIAFLAGLAAGRGWTLIDATIRRVRLDR